MNRTRWKCARQACKNLIVTYDVGFSFRHYQLDFSVTFDDFNSVFNAPYSVVISHRPLVESTSLSLSLFLSWHLLRNFFEHTPRTTPRDRGRGMHGYGGLIANDVISLEASLTLAIKRKSLPCTCFSFVIPILSAYALNNPILRYIYCY